MSRIGIFVLALLTATLAAAGEPQYVVTFAESVEVNDELVQQVARTYGATIEDMRGKQVIVRVSDSRVPHLSSDARVRTIAALSTELIDWNTGVNYTYDGAGNIRQIGNDTFTYDTVGRLVQGQTAGITRTFSYDAFGNRTDCREGGVPCQTTSHAYSAFTNQSSAMQYDPAGNVTSASGHLYEYDAVHMQTRDRVGLTSREFVYTADDERLAVYNVGAWWNWTIRDPSGRVLRELTSEGASGTSNWKWTKDYIWRDSLLLSTIQPGATPGSTTTYHYHLDHLGTPRRITDASDRIVGHHDYHAFGPERPGGRDEPSLTVLKYTGHERDGSDPEALDYMHARYYSAALGRFLSVDPGGFDPKKPQSWNRYAYVMNNPVNAIDPNGKETYIVAHGQGELSPAMQGQAYDVGRQFEIAANTRADQIRGSKGYNEARDDVVVVNTPNADALVAATNKQYSSGKIARVEVFSHAWSGGLNLGGAGNRHVTASTASQINTSNFTRNASFTLWGCNAGTTPSGGGRSFAQQLSNALQMPVRAHTGPTEFNNQGRGNPPMVPSNPQRGAMRVFNPENPNLLRLP